MQKHKYKKRQVKKSLPVTNMFYHISWRWMLAVAGIVCCLLLAAFAISQGQATGNAAFRQEAPGIHASTPPRSDTPVSGIYAPMPKGKGITGAQQTTGIFPLSMGGPIPVPANVLHPINIARVVINNVLTSIYAGCLTRSSAIGVIAILSEDLTTGQQSLHLYQTAQPVGALTILAVHNGILTLATPKAKGTFNLSTDQFHFS